MKKNFPLIAAAMLFAVGAAFAQTPAEPEAPPKVLRIIREHVKPGMGAAHAKIEAGWPHAFAKAASTNYYIGLSSLSGANDAL
ncbi:MAG: hypothetical protein ABI882_08525, partial [Acidobacteriota bacterium]